MSAVRTSGGVRCFLLVLFGLILTFFGYYLGSQSGDPDSTFYMLGLLGMFPLTGAAFLLITMIGRERNEK